MPQRDTALLACPPAYVQRLLASMAGAGGRGWADCFCEAVTSERWEWEDGGVAAYMAATREGLALRVLAGARSFVATASRLDQDALREAARSVATASGAQPFLKAEPAPPRELPSALVAGALPPHLAAAAAGFASRLAALDSALRPRLVLERTARITETHRSGADPAGDASERWLLALTARRPAGPEMTREYALPRWGRREWGAAVEDAVGAWSEPAAPLPRSATVPVVLACGAAAVFLHELVGHLLEADYVLRGASPLARYRDARVSCAELTLTDDPTVAELPGATSADDEGFPAAPRLLLEEGRVAGFLGDVESARAMPEARPGNARRASHNEAPLPRMSNLVVAPGSEAEEDLAHGIEDGLWVDELSGGHVEMASGGFHFRHAVGVRIRGGKRRPGKLTMSLSGEIFAALGAVDRVAAVPSSPALAGWCSKLGQSLLVGSSAPALRVSALEASPARERPLA